MFARRLTALFLALFTLHLNLLGADFACARHGSDGSAMSEQMAGHATMPAASTHEHSSEHSSANPISTSTAAVAGAVNDSEHPPCEVPVQSNCCRALASCSVVFSAENEMQVASIPQFRELIARGAMTAPPSETAAPEPPPPKA